MKLKSKLLISFCIIIFVPILLTVGVLIAFKNIQIKQLEQNYNIENYDYLTNSVQLLSRFTKTDYENLLSVAKSNPEELTDEAYLQETSSEMSSRCSYLVVRIDNSIIFCGEEQEEKLIEPVLPGYGENEMSSDSGMYVDGEVQSLIKQIDFELENGDEGSIFIVTSAEKILPEIKELMIDALISIMAILLLTAGMLIIWIYTSMITPIRKLQEAAQNIKEGNLDFTIEVDSRDEIGALCQDFEEMRQRLKESAEEKIVSEKENKVLISNISHDLKTPITAIKGYVEGIMDGVADTPEKQDKYIRTIYNKANEMNLLINELTLYSQIDTNRIPYNFNKLNLADYFNDCVEEIGLDLEAKNIRLAYFNYTDEAIQIIADPEQLKRVINNIIGNSVKYLDKEKGFISIRIKDVGDFVQIEIEDNGKGVAARDLPYIFDRFYRADASRNSATGGSGIGLSIVKKIIEDHGGKIWATSKEETGTIMYFVLRKYQEVSDDEQSANH